MTMIILLSSVLQASATDYSFTPGVGYTVTHQGNVWKISTAAAIVGSAFSPFSGKDVNSDTIEATIWHYCQNSAGLHEHTLKPMRVILTDKFIILVFNPAKLPDSAQTTRVTGTFNNGEDTFLATGPGFLMCMTGC